MADMRIVLGFVAALAVGWFGSSSVHGQTFQYVKAGGCAHILVYGWNTNYTEVIVVTADRDKLGLKEGTTTLSLVDVRPGLEVKVEQYPRPVRDPDYCTDFRAHDDPQPIATLRAHAGTLTITLGKPGEVDASPGLRGLAQPFMYHATVTLRDLVFKKPDGTVLSIPAPITLKAIVGFFYG